MTPLKEGILSALAYHDVSDMPMTAQEVFLALPVHASFESAEEVLRQIVHEKRAGCSEGFYFLPGRERLVGMRKARYLLAEGKYRRAQAFLALARHVPYLRAAFACNTLARSNARAESDIDLFLVSVPGRLWFTRFCVTGLAALLRLRPTANNASDRICLSFFVVENALDLRALAIENDAYLAHWLHELYPFYDEAGIAERVSAQNEWVREALPQSGPQRGVSRRALAPSALPVKRFVERVFDALFGDRLEGWAKRLQLRWLPSGLRAAAAAPSTGVVLSDAILKFHDHDRRAEIRDAYLKKRNDVLQPVA